MTSRGFTLVELMVVLAIIITITSIVVTSQNSFNKTLILANAAYDVALSIRSAETYGLGGRALGTLPTGYGVHFDVGTPGSYVLFADSDPSPSSPDVCHPASSPTAFGAQPGDCAYALGKDVLVADYTLWSRISISDFCAYTATTKSCASTGLLSLDVVFARPNADPFISANGIYASQYPMTSACLTLSSGPDSSPRSVSVLASGQISVSANPCP